MKSKIVITLIVAALLLGAGTAKEYFNVKNVDTSQIFNKINHGGELKLSGDIQGLAKVQAILNEHHFKNEWEAYKFDCVDTSIATAEFLQQQGYNAKFMIKWSNDTAIRGHVYPVVYVKNGWVAVETTAKMDKTLGVVKRDSNLLKGQVVPTIEELRRIDNETLVTQGAPAPVEYSLSEVIV